MSAAREIEMPLTDDANAVERTYNDVIRLVNALRNVQGDYRVEALQRADAIGEQRAMHRQALSDHDASATGKLQSLQTTCREAENWLKAKAPTVLSGMTLRETNILAMWRRTGDR